MINIKNMKFEWNYANRFYLLTILFQVGVSLFLGAVGLTENSDYSMLMIASELMIILPAILFIGIWYFKQQFVENDVEGYMSLSIAERFMFKPVKLSTLLMCILFTLLIMPLMTLCNLLSQLFVENAVADMIGEMIGYPLPVGLFIIAVMPAFCEEIAFRGVIYGGYRRSVRPAAAMIMSGLLFGLMHLNLNQFGYAFVMGIAVAMLVEATGSIFSSILFHFIINGTSVISAYSLKTMYSMSEIAEIYSETASNDNMLPMIIIYACISIMTGALACKAIGFIARLEGNPNPLSLLIRSRNYDGNRIITPCLIAGIIISVVLIFLLQ